MKKVILLFSVLALIFSSCSSDDDSQDSFIGTWTFHQSFYNDVEETLDRCDKMDTIIVNINGTFNSSTYYAESDGSCSLDNNGSGTWKNTENNTYNVVSNGSITPVQVILEGNTFYFLDIDGTDTYKDIFIRN